MAERRHWGKVWSRFERESMKARYQGSGFSSSTTAGFLHFRFCTGNADFSVFKVLDENDTLIRKRQQ